MRSSIMRPEISFTRSLVIIGFAGIVFFVTDGSRSAKSAQTILPDIPAGFGLPVHFTIPRINVDAPVQQVGLTSGGEMDAPKGPANVGWFKLGPRPGEMGSAVIDGHFGWKNGIPAVFDDINTLRKGDKIYVEDEKGVTITFIVRELRTYDSKADAKDVFNSNDGKAHLNLITCEGVWNAISKSYSGRLVVFADREN